MAIFDDNGMYGNAVIEWKMEPPNPFAKGTA